MMFQSILRSLFVIFSAASICLSSPLFAATQGTLGKTSSGSFTIKLVIQPKLEVRIASTSQQASGSVATVAQFNQKEPICVKGKGIDNFTLTARGSGTKGEFVLTNDKTRYTYGVELWKTPEHNERLVSGKASDRLPSIPTNQDCNTQSAKIAVILNQTVNPQSTLNGALNLTVSAE